MDLLDLHCHLDLLYFPICAWSSLCSFSFFSWNAQLWFGWTFAESLLPLVLNPEFESAFTNCALFFFGDCPATCLETFYGLSPCSFENWFLPSISSSKSRFWAFLKLLDWLPGIKGILELDFLWACCSTSLAEVPWAVSFFLRFTSSDLISAKDCDYSLIFSEKIPAFLSSPLATIVDLI